MPGFGIGKNNRNPATQNTKIAIPRKSLHRIKAYIKYKILLKMFTAIWNR